MGETVIGHSDITADWLTTLLVSHGYPVRVSDVAVAPIGTGQVGATYRFSLAYLGDRGAAPTSLVGKFQSNNPVSRESGKTTLTYLREAGFYRHFGMKKPLPVPQMLYLAFDEDSHDFALIMHDLPHHYAGNQLVTPTLAEAELAMDAAALLHAAWWRNPMLDEQSWMNGAKSATPPIEIESFYAALWPAFCDRYAERVSGMIRTVGDAYLGHICAWQAKLNDAPRCLTHNDFRPDNMLFSPEDSDQPIIIVDWQTVGVGCGAYDIAYYLGTAFNAEDRRAHEAKLFARYGKCLIAAGVSANDVDGLWSFFQISSFAGFLMGVTASMIVERTERGDAMFLAMCERAAAMTVDHAMLDW